MPLDGTKLGRDAFLYMASRGEPAQFAQCETCRTFMPGKGWCASLDTKVYPDSSCGLYFFGAPTDNQTPRRSATAKEAGLVHREVRCENCSWFDDGRCGLFAKLNRDEPDVWELDERVDRHGCCNAQTPRRAHHAAGGSVRGFAEGGDTEALPPGLTLSGQTVPAATEELPPGLTLSGQSVPPSYTEQNPFLAPKAATAEEFEEKIRPQLNALPPSSYYRAPSGKLYQTPAAPVGDVTGTGEPISYGIEGAKEITGPSAAGAFLRSAERGAAPAVGGLAGFAAAAPPGAALGTMVGGPVGGAIGGFVTGTAGALGAGYLVGEAERRLISAMPRGFQEWLGQTPEQQAKDANAHKYAAMAGEIAPNLFLFGPGLLGKAAQEGSILARTFAGAAQRLVPAAIMGAQEAVTQKLQGEPFDPYATALSAGAGALMPHATRLGERVIGYGEAPWRTGLGTSALNALSAGRMQMPPPPGAETPPGPVAPPPPVGSVVHLPIPTPDGTTAPMPFTVTAHAGTDVMLTDPEGVTHRVAADALSRLTGGQHVPPPEAAPEAAQGAAGAPPQGEVVSPQGAAPLALPPPAAPEIIQGPQYPWTSTGGGMIPPPQGFVTGRPDAIAALSQQAAIEAAAARAPAPPMTTDQRLASSLETLRQQAEAPIAPVAPPPVSEAPAVPAAGPPPVPVAAPEAPGPRPAEPAPRGAEPEAAPPTNVDQTFQQRREDQLTAEEAPVMAVAEAQAREARRQENEGLLDAATKRWAAPPLQDEFLLLRPAAFGQPLTPPWPGHYGPYQRMADVDAWTTAGIQWARSRGYIDEHGALTPAGQQRYRDLERSGSVTSQPEGWSPLGESEARPAAPPAPFPEAAISENMTRYADNQLEDIIRENRARGDETATKIADLAEAELARRRPAAERAPETAPAAAEHPNAPVVTAEKHTRTGADLFFVRFPEKPDIADLGAQARKMGGQWSSFRGGGMQPGWRFKTREAADRFAEWAREQLHPAEMPATHPQAIPEHPGLVVQPLRGGPPEVIQPPGTRAPSDWTEIGKNHIGQTLYEDQRGVRSYVENGVRHTEPVGLRPTRGGMEYTTDRTDRPEYQVAEAPSHEPNRPIEYKPPETRGTRTAQEIADDLEKAREDTNANPTEAQKASGNYAKGKASFHGIPFVMETPRGEMRRGVDANGEPWEVEMPVDYGYISRTEGADGDHVDAYIGDHVESQRAFVVDQVHADTGAFDEHKVMLGFNDWPTAREAYMDAFSDGRGAERIGNVTPMTLDELKDWLKTGDTRSPIGQAALPLEQRPAGEHPAATTAPTRPENAPVASRPYGSANKVFTQDMAAAARERLRQKLGGGQLNVGFDPTIFSDGVILAGYHIEAGAHKFADFARAMMADVGEAIRPYLSQIYEGVRRTPGFDASRMTPEAEVLRELAAMPTLTPGEETGHGLQNALPSGPERAGPETVHGAASPRPAGSAPPPEIGGGPRNAPRPPGPAQEPGVGGEAGGGGDRLPHPDHVPAGETAEGERGAAGRPAGAVSGRPQAGRVPDADVKGTNHVIEPGSLAEERTPRVKARDNISAIEIAKKIIDEARPATKEEQAALAKYVGWGGLANAFPDPTTGRLRPQFEQIGQRLRELLSPDEYRTAARSTQYAHYTSEPVIRAMWDAVGRMGFKGGSVFEPGMGIGHFLGMMPPDVAAASKYQGLELDHLTSKIAKLLYPESGVRQADFTRTPMPEGAFDLAIGNPPFSDTVIRADPKYAPRGFMLHDYFFAKSLDSVRPGGLLAFVTSAGTMNKIDGSARRFMAERAEFVGGIRLPSTAFAKNAGTEVTTDILFFKKRPATVDLGETPPEWTDTVFRTLPDANGNPVEGPVSRYFAEHPEMVLGEEGFFDKLYKGRYAVHETPGTVLEDQLREALGRLPENVMDAPLTPEQKAALDFSSTEKKDGSFYVGPDGRLMQYSEGVGRPVPKRGAGVEGGKTVAEMQAIREMLPIRDALREVFKHDLAELAAGGEEGGTLQAQAKARATLNRVYDDFVKRNGPINKAEYSYRRPNIIQQESARSEAREDARELYQPWEEGTFDPTNMIARKASTGEIARARRAAREDAARRGQPFDEGSFDPEEMADIPIVKRPNIDAMKDGGDQEAFRLLALEDYDPDTGIAEKRRIFYENPLTRMEEPDLRSPHDGVLWSMNKFGRLDLDAIAAKLGSDRDQVVAELGSAVMRLPGTEEVYEPRDAYLSGDVVSKLEEAKAAADKDPRFQANVTALQEAQPEPLSPAVISMTLGMPWIPAETTAAFAEHAGIGRVSINYSPLLGQWMVRPVAEGARAPEWGTGDFGAHELLAEAMNRRTPIVRRHDRGPPPFSWVDVDATQAAQDRVQALKEAFADWAQADPARAHQLATIYNGKYNRIVLRNWNGDYLTTPGVSADWNWRAHQTRVIARIIQDGNTYMAHAVGAGKTSAMIGSGMEMRRLGLINKPMYVVPNHMLGQFAKEFYEQYPTARIMVADDRNFHTSRRKQFVANIGQQDLDAVIITNSAFKMIPISEEFNDKMIREAVDEIDDALIQLGQDPKDTKKLSNGVDPADRYTVKRLQNRKEKLEQRLLGATTGAPKDVVNTFEELGVDFLFVDEAHNFRKLSYVTQTPMKGIDSEGSDKSWDLYTKIRYLDENRPGRSLVMASGTPITNTMGELYSLSRYIQPQALKDNGVAHFDSWAQSFGDTKTDLEQTATGAYESVTRFAKFVNLPELFKMVASNMDIVTSEQLAQYVTRPELEGDKRNTHVAPQTDWMKEFQKGLGQRVNAIRARRGRTKKRDDILLSVIGDGRKGAIDPRLVDPNLPSDPASKLNMMINNVYRIWKETKNQPFYDPATGYQREIMRGPATQMVFSNLGIEGGDGKFSAYDFMRREWIRRGIPANEIAFIKDYKGTVNKQRVINDMNDGKIRILVGSTEKMGTGINAQRRLIAIHNLDPLWFPADDEQRNGRGLRQGNLNPRLQIHDYSTKGTYDSTMWSMMARKGRFIEQFFRGDPNLREIEDIGEAGQYEQAAAMATADERVMKLTEARQALQKLERQANAHSNEQYTLDYRARNHEANAARNDEVADQYAAVAARARDISGDNFRMVVAGRDFTKRGEAAAAIEDYVKENLPSVPFKSRIPVGEIGGFGLFVEPDSKVEKIANKLELVRGDGASYSLDFAPGFEMTLGGKTGIGAVRAASELITTLGDRVAKYREDARIERTRAEFNRAALGKPFADADKIGPLRRQIAEMEEALQRPAEEVGEPRTAGTPGPRTELTPEGVMQSAGWRAPMLAEERGPFGAAEAPPFFSALTRAVEAIPQPRALGAQWANLIRNLASKGVKQDEVDWSGVMDWLKEHPGAVTKDALLNQLRANEVRVEEVQRGGGNAAPEERITQEELTYAILEGGNAEGYWFNAQDQAGQYREAEELAAAALRGEPTAIDLIKQVVPEETVAMLNADRPNPARYPEYTLPGGENYRELLLTLPERNAERIAELRAKLADASAEWESLRGQTSARARARRDALDAELMALRREESALSLTEQRGRYQSGHWEEPNVVAHIRFDDRTDAEGRKVLHVAEIQSDWHQQGRRRGYQEEGAAAIEKAQRRAGDLLQEANRIRAEAPRLSTLKAEFEEAMARSKASGRFTVVNPETGEELYRAPADANTQGNIAYWMHQNRQPGRPMAVSYGPDRHAAAFVQSIGDQIVALEKRIDTADQAWREADQFARSLIAEQGSRVPSAPFKTQWPQLAMKRVLRYAAEHGYDRVTWDTGETQAARYDLSRHIQKLELDDNASGGVGRPNMEGSFKEGMLRAYSHDGRKVLDQSVRSPAEIVNLVGKEAADKLLAAEPVENRHAGLGVRHRSLEGLDLRVGGEGMRGFYDKMLPAFLNKYAKKWGAKVERGEGLPTKVNPEDMSEAEISAVMHGGGPEALERGHLVHAIDITPQMRESVMRGQALWERGRTPGGYEDRQADFAQFAGARRDTHGAARDYVLDRGRATGHEYMTIVDPKTGLIDHALTSNEADGARFSPEVQTRLLDPEASLILHHYHPADTALSSVDVGILAAPGAGWVVAHGAGGDVFAARLTDAAKPLLPVEGGDTMLRNLYRHAAGRITDGLKRLVDRGVITNADAERLYADLTNRALAAAGVTEYASSRAASPLEDVIAKALIGRAARSVRQMATVFLGHDLGADINARVHRSTDTVQFDRAVAGFPGQHEAELAAGRTRGARADQAGRERAGESPEGRLAEERPPESDEEIARRILAPGGGGRGGGEGPPPPIPEGVPDPGGKGPVHGDLARVMFTDERTTADRIREAIRDANNGGLLLARQRLQDQIAALEKTEKTIHGGRLAPGGLSGTMALREAQNWRRTLNLALRDRQVRYNADTGQIEPILDSKPLYGKSGILTALTRAERATGRPTVETWAAWKIATRAKRLMAEGRERNVPQWFIDKYENADREWQNPDGSNLFHEVDAEMKGWHKNLLDLLEASGVINREGRALWEHEDYLPFYRALDEEEGRVGGPRQGPAGGLIRSPIHMLRGGEQKINNVFENYVLNAGAIIRRSMENLARQKIETDLLFNSDILRPMNKEARVAFGDPVVQQGLRDAGLDPGALTPNAKEAARDYFGALKRRDPGMWSVMHDGKARVYHVENPLVLESLLAAGPGTITGVGALLTGPARLLRSAVVFDPAFAIAHNIRMGLHSWNLTGVSPFQGIVESLRQIRGPSEEALRLMAAGALSGKYDIPTHVRREFMSPEYQRSLITTPLQAYRFMRHIAERVTEAADVGPRIAVYKDALRRGLSEAEAIDRARGILDFSTHGNWGPAIFLAQTIPFLNARIQGIARSAQGFAGEERNAILMRTALVTAATAALWYQNKDDPEYQRKPDWDREYAWQVKIAPGTWIRIPKFYELGALGGTIPEMLLNYWNNGSSRELVNALGSTFLNVFRFNPIPVAIRPGLEVWWNHDSYTGQPIVNEREQQLDPSSRYGPTDSQSVIALTQAYNAAMPHALQIAPANVQHLLRGYLAGWGAYVTSAADYLGAQAGVLPEQPAQVQTPVVGRFVHTTPEASNRIVNDFYELRNQIASVGKSIREAQATHDTAFAEWLRSQHPEYNPGLESALNAAGTQLSDARRPYWRIQRDPNLTSGQKTEARDAYYRRRDEIADRLKPLLRRAEGLPANPD